MGPPKMDCPKSLCPLACRRLNNKISARRTRERKNFQLRKLEEENEALGRQILMLQQQVTELRSANHVLLQNLPQISDHQRYLVSLEQHAWVLVVRWRADNPQHCSPGLQAEGLVQCHIWLLTCTSAGVECVPV